MIASLSLILLCQLAGEVIVRGLALPMPGPVVGLLFLLLLLLAHLSLLFVPAGVGVVQKLDLVAAHGIAFAGVLAVSVLVTLLVTVTTFLLASRLMSRGGSAP